MTITLLIPFFNYAIEPFRVSVDSIHWQTKHFDEVIISDFSTNDWFQSSMEEICKENGFKYIHTSINASDKVIGVHLWTLVYNIGIRASTSDLVMLSGTDRVYEKNLVECFTNYHGWCEKNNKKCVSYCGVKDLYRLPKVGEDYYDLMREAKARGGKGVFCASREWLCKVRGLDESLRWYADLDLIRRAKLDGYGAAKLHNKRTKYNVEPTSCLHIRLHKKSRKMYGGQDVKDIARLGKRKIHRTLGDRTIVRNDEDWGILNSEKVRRAKRLAGEL